ncbi:MAG: DUF305 domain-containing protein [Gemmatimonadales bacterium]
MQQTDIRRPAGVLTAIVFAVLAALPASAQIRHTAADADFMRGMMAHHGQAVVMSRLVPDRSQFTPVRMLAERIDVSQKDEIALMRQWLLDRGEPVPDTGAAGHHHHGPNSSVPMAGMLTQAELDRLATLHGTEFDRLFLELMIRHHEGAITMVKALFGTPASGQETEIFRLAADIEADQRAEIRRMQNLLKNLSSTETR